MKYGVKQLIRELFKNKLFLALLFLLSAFTSFLYYFVHFSADENLAALNGLAQLSDRQILYRNGMESNVILARNSFIAFLSLTGFVFGMFYYRFFYSNRKQLGCLKALGFRDLTLRRFFVVFTACLSFVSAAVGLAAGYFVSDVLISASKETYLVTGLLKGIHAGTFAVGMFVPPFVFAGVSYLVYSAVKGKEISSLISDGGETARYHFLLRLADRVAKHFPVKKQLPVRLILRKPVPLCLIVFSVASFSILFILAYSLNLSSETVFRSQTEGRAYQYDTHFDTPQFEEVLSQRGQTYLDWKGTLQNPNTEVEQTLIGVDEAGGLFTLFDEKGTVMQPPEGDGILIGTALRDLYGFHVGEEIAVTVGAEQRRLKITGVALNAEQDSVYLEKGVLSGLLDLPASAYTGVWSDTDAFPHGTVTSRAERIEELRRGAVSNRSSAVINQVIGCVIGGILLYLAVLLNFQDSVRDVLILHLMGYQTGQIRKMLIDLYRPFLWLSFFVTLWPGMAAVRMILKSLSLQIGEYIPFQTNWIVVSGVFLVLNGIYWGVQKTFDLGIRRVIAKGELLAAVY